MPLLPDRFHLPEKPEPTAPTAPVSNSPAGWYQDPQGPPGQMRYWDGATWGVVAPPVAVAVAALPPQHPSPGLAGYIVALLLPIVGVIWAIVCFVRGQAGDGVGLVLVSLLGVALATAIFGSP